MRCHRISHLSLLIASKASSGCTSKVLKIPLTNESPKLLNHMVKHSQNNIHLLSISASVIFPSLWWNIQHPYLNGEKVCFGWQFQFMVSWLWLQSRNGMAEGMGEKSCCNTWQPGRQREKEEPGVRKQASNSLQTVPSSYQHVWLPSSSELVHWRTQD